MADKTFKVFESPHYFKTPIILNKQAKFDRQRYELTPAHGANN